MATQRSSGVVGWLVFAALVVAVIWWNPVGKRRTPSPAPPPKNTVIADAAVALVADASVPEPPSDAAPDADEPGDAAIDAASVDPLYTITEALDDIGASSLEYIGTGAWFGTFSIKACAYRNKSVLVVYDYCTGREQPALGLHVISPTRGSLHVYAEAGKPISTLVRSEYMTFRIDGYPQTEPPPQLDFTFAEVNAWHERRYHSDAGACSTGDGDSMCTTELTDRLDAWEPSAKALIDEPPPRWYEVVKSLRARTLRGLRGTK